jgi:hypothetical protein
MGISYRRHRFPPAVNCKSFAFRISGISAGANSFDVSWAKRAPSRNVPREGGWGHEENGGTTPVLWEQNLFAVAQISQGGA